MESTVIFIIVTFVIILAAVLYVIEKIKENIKVNLEIKKLLIEKVSKLSKDIETLEINNSKLINISIEKINKNIEINNSNHQTILDELTKLNTNLSSSTQEVQKELISFEKYQINNKKNLENNYQNIVKLVNNLRLDNLINVSNEIGKYKNGIVEDEYFSQEVGFCKIIRFTDKNTNEITEVFYNEDGEKSHTETFKNDKLKYKMKYDNNTLSEGFEYNDQQQIIFAFKYDQAGEVSSKIEYEYDKNNKQIEKTKIEY